MLQQIYGIAVRPKCRTDNWRHFTIDVAHNFTLGVLFLSFFTALYQFANIYNANWVLEGTSEIKATETDYECRTKSLDADELRATCSAAKEKLSTHRIFRALFSTVDASLELMTEKARSFFWTGWDFYTRLTVSAVGVIVLYYTLIGCKIAKKKALYITASAQDKLVRRYNDLKKNQSSKSLETFVYDYPE